MQISIFAPPCPLLALFLNYDKRCFSQLKLHVEVDITSFYTFNAPKTVKTVKIKTKSRVYYFFLLFEPPQSICLIVHERSRNSHFCHQRLKPPLQKGQCLVPTLSSIFVLVAGPCSKFPQVPHPYPCPQPSS